MADMHSLSVEKAFLTEIEVAEYLKMSRNFLRLARQRLKANGKSAGPPFVKMGRSVRYMRADLDAWIDQNKKAK